MTTHFNTRVTNDNFFILFFKTVHSINEILVNAIDQKCSSCKNSLKSCIQLLSKRRSKRQIGDGDEVSVHANVDWLVSKTPQNRLQAVSTYSPSNPRTCSWWRGNAGSSLSERRVVDNDVIKSAYVGSTGLDLDPSPCDLHDVSRSFL